MSTGIGTIEDKDFKLRYYRFGREGGRKAVILPGLSVTSVVDMGGLVAAQYAALADDYDVFLFNRREDIPEEELSGGYPVDAMAEDQARAMDALEIKDAYVLGISQGGMIAQALIAERSDLIRSAVLCATVSKLNEMSRQVFDEWAVLAEQHDVDGLLDSFAEKLYTKDFMEKNGEALKSMAGVITENDLRRFAAFAHGMTDFDRSQLTEPACAVKVMGAEHDLVFGLEAVQDLAKQLGAEEYIYKDLGHAFFDEAPDFPNRLKEFFDRT